MEEGETTNLLKIEFAECGDIKEEALQDDENVAASSSAVGTSSISTIVKAEPLDIIDKNEDDKIPLQEDPNLGDFLQVDLAEPVEIKVEPVVTAAENDRVTDEPMNEDQGGEAKKNLGKNQDLPVAGSSGRSSVQDDLDMKQARWKALVRQAEEAAKLSPGRRKTKPCRCSDCGLTCPNKTALKMHRQQHHGNRDDLSCPDCPFRAACQSRLEEHLSVHRGEKPLSCDLCQYRTAYRNNLHKHRQVVHPPRKNQISCHLCNYSTHVRSYLRKHLKTHAGIKRDPPTGRELTCDLCPYKTRVKECLKHHLKTHSGERPFPCKYCDYRAAIQKSLTTHLKRKHGVEVVPKRVLPKQPDRRSKKEEEEFVCEDCPMRFYRRHALVRHRRKHTGERPYTCDYCYRSFALKNALTRHILAHMGVKNYACDQCDKRYSDNKSLRKHKMTVHPAEGLVAS